MRLDATKEQFKEVVALNNNFPFGMLLGGIALLVSSSVECADIDCDGEGEALGVIMSTILIVLQVLYIYLIYHGIISEQTDSLYSIVLFLGWTFTSAFVTFEAPFEIAGNGFVAAWIGFVSALGNLIYNVKWADLMKERVLNQGLPLGILGFSSAVVLIAGLSQGCCDEEDIAAVVAGAVSIVFVTLRVFIGNQFDRLFGLFLVVWWTVIGLYLTFSEFKDIGNGFIGTWLSIGSSYLLISRATLDHNVRYSARMSKRQDNPQNNNTQAYTSQHAVAQPVSPANQKEMNYSQPAQAYQNTGPSYNSYDTKNDDPENMEELF